MKKILSLSVLVIASCSFAMESDAFFLGSWGKNSTRVNNIRNENGITAFFTRLGFANKKINITWLNKKSALIFGVGAFALVTVGYSTYVLYQHENNTVTLKEITEAVKKHPYITAGSVTGTLALIGGVFAYKYYGRKLASQFSNYFRK